MFSPSKAGNYIANSQLQMREKYKLKIQQQEYEG